MSFHAVILRLASEQIWSE